MKSFKRLSRRTPTRTGAAFLDKASKEVSQGLIVRFLVAGVGHGAFFLLGPAGFAILGK
jgi:hypothetical protein